MPATTLLRNWVRIYSTKAEAPVMSQVSASCPSLQTALHPSLWSMFHRQPWCQAPLTVQNDWQRHTSNSGIYPRNIIEVWDALKTFWGGVSLMPTCVISAADTSPSPLCTSHDNLRAPMWGEGECRSLDSCSRKWLIYINEASLKIVLHFS